MWGYTLSDLFERGGFVMYPLLACSILAVCVAIERIIVFLFRAGSYRQLSSQLSQRLGSESVVEVREWLQLRRTPLARVADCYLAQLDRAPAIRDEVVAQQASQQVTLLERRIHWLSVIGHLAPMIGLLGTVWGLVDAFHQIEAHGGNVQPGDLASGIWQALLTTVFGLIVALPTLAIYHFLDNRVAAITLQMEWLVTELNVWRDGTPAGNEAVQASGSSTAGDAP
jgi:biopolymer transport protein ExbB